MCSQTIKSVVERLLQHFEQQNDCNLIINQNNIQMEMSSKESTSDANLNCFQSNHTLVSNQSVIDSANDLQIVPDIDMDYRQTQRLKENDRNVDEDSVVPDMDQMEINNEDNSHSKPHITNFYNNGLSPVTVAKFVKRPLKIGLNRFQTVKRLHCI
jgi:hypothetical protein